MHDLCFYGETALALMRGLLQWHLHVPPVAVVAVGAVVAVVAVVAVEARSEN